MVWTRKNPWNVGWFQLKSISCLWLDVGKTYSTQVWVGIDQEEREEMKGGDLWRTLGKFKSEGKTIYYQSLCCISIRSTTLVNSHHHVLSYFP